MYAVNAREPYTLRSWTRSGTPTPPAPASARPSSPVATSSSTPSTSSSSGWPVGAPSARSCSPGCAASARPCCSTRCARPRCAPGWGTGKLEARPDQSLRRPLASAVHQAVRELGPAGGAGRPRARRRQGVRPARRRRSGAGPPSCATGGTPASRVPAVTGRADSGDIEIDLVELLSDLGGIASDTGRGIAVFIDEMQDLGPDDVSALCAACHEISQSRLPVIVVGAGLPHLPAVLSASKSYSERLFRYSRIDRLDRAAADAALVAPGRGRGRRVHRPRRSTRCTPRPAATPTSSRRTARRSGTSPRHPR